MSTDTSAALQVKDNSDDEKLTLRELRHTNLRVPVDLARDGHESLDHCSGTTIKPRGLSQSSRRATSS